MAEDQKKPPREIRVLYGDAVTVLPMAAADAAERASGLDCKILMCLSADPAARSGAEGALESFADRIGCSVEEVEEAIAYWRGAGVLEYAGGAGKGRSERKTGRPKKQTPDEVIAAELKKRGTAAAPKSEEPPASEQSGESERKVRRADELPNYTIEELTKLLETRKELSLFIDECQRAYGKMFNPRDVSMIIGLLEYLSLDETYVLMLLRYFGEMPETERKSLRYVERMAFSLADGGITDVPTLSAHLDSLKAMKECEGQIRTVFGMGGRAFTAKEKAAVLRWLGEFGSGMDLIRLAYERTVNATGKASIAYASKILERWHNEGLKTAEAVEASEQKLTPNDGGNFETNDFFEAALRRSYGEAFEDAYRGGTGSDGGKKDS